MPRLPVPTYLQRILPRKPLVTIAAPKWLDGQVYPLVPLQVVVPVEGLRALAAFERALGLRRWRAPVVDVEMVWVMGRQARMVTVPGHPWNPADHGQGGARVVHVAEHRARIRAV
jgi:hypothetical protein